MKYFKKRWKVCLNVPTAAIPGHIIKVDDDVQLPIASVWEGGGTNGKKFFIAVAHLISAAPELLLFLKRAVPALYYVRDDARDHALEALRKLKHCGGKEIVNIKRAVERWDAIADQTQAEINTVLAAIAKAEGKKPKATKSKPRNQAK